MYESGGGRGEYEVVINHWLSFTSVISERMASKPGAVGAPALSMTREKLQHSRSSSDLADDEESPPPPAASPARRSPRIDVSK